MKIIPIIAALAILEGCATPAAAPAPTVQNWTANPCLHKNECGNRPFPVAAAPYKQVDEGLGATGGSGAAAR